MSITRRDAVALLAGASLLPTAALADPKGLALSQDRYDRDRGWGDSSAAATMTLSAPGRSVATREMEIRVLETSGDGDLSITHFDTPRNLRGTKFLTHSFATAPDDQWIFLPEAGKVRRISSRNKSGAFLGSEFTFEDLSSFKVAKYDYTYEGAETVNGVSCHVVGQVPRYAHTGYSKVTVWLDEAHLRPLQTAFFDRRGKHFKTMTFDAYEVYEGRFWRAHAVEMSNLTNGKVTRMDFTDFRFGIGLSPREFDPARLG
ncbi:MAG: outer membrane lipoprotein-sorting protein [Pseudomonadota bacterium]